MRITALKDSRIGNKRVMKNETIDVPDKVAEAFVRTKAFKMAGASKTPIGKSTELKVEKNQTYKTRQVKAEE